jgi:hypothetical protein
LKARICADLARIATHSATQRQKGYTENDVTLCFIWRARRDSNSRPLGSKLDHQTVTNCNQRKVVGRPLHELHHTALRCITQSRKTPACIFGVIRLRSTCLPNSDSEKHPGLTVQDSVYGRQCSSVYFSQYRTLKRNESAGFERLLLTQSGQPPIRCKSTRTTLSSMTKAIEGDYNNKDVVLRGTQTP